MDLLAEEQARELDVVVGEPPQDPRVILVLGGGHVEQPLDVGDLAHEQLELAFA